MDKTLKGVDLSNVKDKKGNLFFMKFKEVVTTDPGAGWVDYTWPKPDEKDASPKRAYVTRVPGENDIYIGAGYYAK